MPINITMPALSPTMEEGNLSKWLVKEGDKIAPGDVIAEIETDKATMEVEAVDEGTVAKIVVPAGSEGVKVNALIAILAEEGEDVAAAAKGAASVSKADAPKEEPKPAEVQKEAAVPVAAPTPAKVEPSAAASNQGTVCSPHRLRVVSPGIRCRYRCREGYRPAWSCRSARCGSRSGFRWGQGCSAEGGSCLCCRSKADVG